MKETLINRHRYGWFMTSELVGYERPGATCLTLEWSAWLLCSRLGNPTELSGLKFLMIFGCFPKFVDIEISFCEWFVFWDWDLQARNDPDARISVTKDELVDHLWPSQSQSSDRCENLRTNENISKSETDVETERSRLWKKSFMEMSIITSEAQGILF